MQLSTCRFGIKDNRITCAERPRIKSLESVGKNYGEDGKDTKNVTIVQELRQSVASECSLSPTTTRSATTKLALPLCPRPGKAYRQRKL